MINTKEISSESAWEKFVQKKKEANFLQSYYYGVTNEKCGNKVFQIGFYEGQTLHGICLYILEKARRATYLTVAGGPILDWDNKKVVSEWLNKTRVLAQDNGASFVRVRPQLLDTAENRKIFKSLGFINAPMHLSAQVTLQLSLDKPLESILQQMRKNTRYEIRKAEKFGIEVSKTQKLEDINTFLTIQRETATRQKFIPFRDDFVKTEYEVFTKQDMATLYSAKYKSKLLAQAVVIHYPTESSYHFGGTTEEGRNLPGAYAVQWEAIKDAQARKIPRYNFWGIVEKEQTKHRYYGVSVFKRGFGGEQINYLPAHDLITNPVNYWPSYMLETYRRITRGL
jgi:lipid II:glycine glycyltransferase (peptidoglycan interpeptide bridge formation enzyme)